MVIDIATVNCDATLENAVQILFHLMQFVRWQLKTCHRLFAKLSLKRGRNVLARIDHSPGNGPLPSVFPLYRHKLELWDASVGQQDVARFIATPPCDDRIGGVVGTVPSQQATSTQPRPTPRVQWAVHLGIHQVDPFVRGTINLVCRVRGVEFNLGDIHWVGPRGSSEHARCRVLRGGVVWCIDSPLEIALLHSHSLHFRPCVRGSERI
mmetsp:Transcript_35168/g.92025  ORF Transcript_35168/g.92025 Transcript_35168/m.92025 type:complete len:209 (-) Transcript_35168:615-1241(-)